ncbi:MAG TPA: UDP-glucuronic acid decarboxylase family protein, partial [Candidatus Limnocylindria bacterium]|nr:UDP-glucuronic acid decarboxylase family protein [Candidatus Limnocylindria bacterium]
MALKKKTILVAGGAGFIGSHLCDVLLTQGHFVIALDNLITGSRKNIAHLAKHKRFKFIKADVSKVTKIKADEIYHLASPASPPYFQKYAIEIFKANIWGAYNLLELAKKNKARMLFASTSEVYGQPLQHPQKETYFGNVNTVGIRSCYDESKRAAEALCMDYHRKFGVDLKIIRIFNTYGPRMFKNDGRVVSNFITQALAGKPLEIYGNGRQTRSFQYVDDLVSGIVKMMASPKTFIGPVNLGNPNEFTIIELAKKVLRLTGSKSKLIYKALPKDDPRQRKPDISLAQKKLKWKPMVNLEAGLSRT